jgi:hypothetical protein
MQGLFPRRQSSFYLMLIRSNRQSSGNRQTKGSDRVRRFVALHRKWSTLIAAGKSNEKHSEMPASAVIANKTARQDGRE